MKASNFSNNTIYSSISNARMVKRLTILLLFLVSCTTTVAQTELVGKVADSTGVSLPGASITLIKSLDSTTVANALTDTQGTFKILNIAPGTYILRASYVGFERPDKAITVSANDQYLDYGNLIMYEAGYLLEGVEITADRIAVQMRGDTMLYNAEAFAVGKNAVVEDLIRRLPGMSVDVSGGITFRGRPINEVMINGKPFFAGNSTLLTQNLDAEAISTIEMYDQRTDSEVVTGIDDGEENLTVNLKMKEKYKAKVFGELYGGIGTQERYQAGGKTFRISERSQLGVLGTINNVNRIGFSGDEISGFNGSTGRDRGRWWEGGGDGKLAFDNGSATGENRSIAAGINYGAGVGKNGQFTADYALFDRSQVQRANTIEAFNRTDNRRIVETLEDNNTINYSHRVGFDYRQELDSTARLRLNGNITMAGGENRSVANTNITNDGLANEFLVEEQNRSMTPSGQFRLSYNKAQKSNRSKSSGRRTFGVNAYGNFSENQTNLNLLTEGIEPGLDLPGVLVNGRQVQDRLNNTQNIGAGAEFAEPLSAKWRLSLETEADVDKQQGNFTFQLAELSRVNLLERSWQSVRGAASLVHFFGKQNRSSIGFGTWYQSSNLTLGGDETRDETYGYVLPFVRFRKRFDKGTFGANLRSSPSAPSISQLQTIANPNASGRVSVGNSSLEPALSYRYNSWFYFNDEDKAVGFNGSFDWVYTDNAFGNEVTFIDGQQIFRTINVNNTWQVSGDIGTTIALKPLNSELRIEGRGYANTGTGIVDNVTRINTSSSYTVGGRITTEINEKSYVRIGYNFNNFTNTSSGGRSDANTSQLTDNLDLAFELEVSPKWRFESRFSYANFRETEFSEQQQITDLRLSIEVRPFKTAGHFIRAAASDIFNQNTIVNRNVGQFSTTETTANGLGRYFLITFHYNI